MASTQSGLVVVVDYPQPAQAQKFTLPMPREHARDRSPSLDSGIAMSDEIVYSSKLRGVVVTVPRKRFRRTDSEATTASCTPRATSDSHGRNESRKNVPRASATQTSLSRTAPQTVELRSGSERQRCDGSISRIVTDESRSTKTKGRVRTSKSRVSSSASLRPPPAPRPARLPTPEIPDVDESLWWGK